MQVTIFGIIWLPILGAAMFLPLRYLASLVVFSAIFQAASVLNVGTKGISPFFISQAMFSLCALVRIKVLPARIPRWAVVLLVLIAFAILVTLLAPLLFKGTLVYVPDQGIDEAAMYGGSPLSYSAGQLAQCVYLLVNVVTLGLFYFAGRLLDWRLLWRVFMFSLWLVVFIGLWEFSSKIIGYPFPSDFFYSNPGVAQLSDQLTFGIDRLNSTYTEPSNAGAVLAAFFWMTMMSSQMSYLALILILGTLVCTVSGTGVAALLAGMVYRVSSKYGVSILLVLALFLFAGLILSGYAEILLSLLSIKFESHSGVSRLTADVYAFELVPKTFGFGVGLGSNRPSGLLAYVVSNLGVIGSGLWGGFVFLFLFDAHRCKLPYKSDVARRRSLIMYVVVILAGQAVSVPDLNLMSTWVCLFVIAAMLGSNDSISRPVAQDRNV